MKSCLILFLITVTIFSIITIVILVLKNHRIKHRLNDVCEILDDIAKGNDDHKILAAPTDVTASICYKINEIVYDYREQLISLKKAEQTNKQLMTSLSHDVRTPLTTLIGYLDAAQKGIVEGQEREQYIETARIKAYDMKEYIDKLFEWFKLNSGEETFDFQRIELSESTRNILQNWIPIFENIQLNYDIDIPEKSILVSVDHNAYSRIINNLIQNVVAHSRAKKISVKIKRNDTKVSISISDDGKGIPKQDLPFIFDRLYKCDKARSEKGSGLGLSIVQQLIRKMGGSIDVQSVPFQQTEFIMKLPLDVS
ncbi:sensor histidine kinase [Pelosinus baikalensis]|uniref:histidine kinase n=1 Tax=Pelosinus baikalensis TaxID=2892015 RepID=A0ABS8HR69_9FIRM|nr:HAMP domain-containing sensor histidine kinase [Pelosinus baikalensis]MCC5465673.1 HAMP domain-containing histidine kinase [Pelosinus baikalensis]